jgi:small subunit ribosomal protein S6
MNRYEAMFIVNPDLSADDRKTLFNQISDTVTKNSGSVSNAAIWMERRKLYFPIKKHQEGLYYLVNFSVAGLAIKEINHAYKLNENILRVLITQAL